MDDIKGQVALITGGSSGIGRATAVALAQQGVHTVVTGRSTSGLKDTIDAVYRVGGKVQVVEADVSQPDHIEQMVAKAAQEYGRLDLLVNNAGTQGEVAKLADQRLESFEEVFATNVMGVFLTMKYAIPHILKNGGAIVNVASGGGLVGVPGASVYCASKHAVVGMTKVAALDYATQGIRVNAVCPGGVDTPMLQRFFDSVGDEAASQQARAEFNASHPMGRIATSEEVADAIAFLCSPRASFITGTTLSVDGGYVAH